MITSGYGKVAEYSLGCGEMANKLYNNSQRDDGTCLERLGAQALFLAQVIVSIVALPLNLIAMIFCPLLALCTEGPEKAWELFKGGVFCEYMHYAMLPISILGVFAPQYATK